MNCQSLLSQLPEDWHEKLEMDFSSLLEQGFSMEQCLTDVTAMKQLYTSFTRAEKAALMTIISSIGTQPFRQTDFVDQVVNLDTRVSPAEQLVGLLYLRQKAVVFTT